MQTLFSEINAYPSGFSYFPDFLSVAEESQMLEMIRGIEFHTFLFQGFEAKRRVASFGYDYSFEKKTLSRGREIPPEFELLIKNVALTGKVQEDFAELLVTEYPIGSVINWHRDAPPFDLIAGVSLLADCTFRLRPHDKSKQGRGSIISVPVKRRSLYLMQGEVRSEWQHSISPVKQKRYSITLRTVKHK